MDSVTHEAIHQFDKQGRKGIKTTKENISKVKENIQKRKAAAEQPKKQAEKQTLENIHRFKQELESEKQCHMKLFTQYKEWQLKEQERISKLKINVPEALQSTYEQLSRLEE